MSNVSIKSAFERMWHHVVLALNGKSDNNHTHSEFYSKSETESYVANAVSAAKTELTLSSANGKKFRITIDDDGILTATEIVENAT